jgi:hypothetical protein
MRKQAIKFVLAGVVAAGSQLGAMSAQAAPCGGLVDVESTLQTGDFCESVEWIKNRGVTLGCAVGLYCPFDNVTRLQMAAFMKRLGDAVTPKVLTHEASPGPINLDVLERVCVTPNIDPAPVPPATIPGKPYPRRAVIQTTFSGQAAGALQYVTEIQFSTDNGASWDFVWPNFANFAGTSAAHWVSSSHSGAVDLLPDLDYKFAITVNRQGGGANDFLASRCFVTVEVFSRTGTASPFDANPVKLPNADH